MLTRKEALASLSSQALPGVHVRGLLTDHYVRSRLPTHQATLRERLSAAATAARGKREWRDALGALGYDIRQRPDGYEIRHGRRLVALTHAKANANEFARMDESGRLPEGMLIAACQADGLRWGIMTAGSRMRLFEARTDRGAATDRWIDIDLAALPDEHAHLLGLFAQDALREGGVWRDLIADVRQFGTELKERLDDQIRSPHCRA
jgi:hypothetical protein